MASRKVRGTTSSAGKTTTRKPARVVADSIERPHGGKGVRQVGAQTGLERQALSGSSGARASSVKQVGPSSIRPANAPTGKVKRVGASNVEDVLVVEGLGTPYARQSGSVRHVGPADRSFTKLTEGTGGAGVAKSGRVTRSRRIIHNSTLLKSGVGRRHPWAVFAGQPGTKKGNRAVRVAGGAGNNVLVNGRTRKFSPEPLGDTQVTPDGPSVVPGA